MMSAVVSGEVAERVVVPVALCCGQCREEAGAGGRRGWRRAEAGLPCGVAVDGSTWDWSAGATVGHARGQEPRLPPHANLHSTSQLNNKTSWCTLMSASPFLCLQRHPRLGITWVGAMWLRKPHRDRQRGASSSLPFWSSGWGWSPGVGISTALHLPCVPPSPPRPWVCANEQGRAVAGSEARQCRSLPRLALPSCGFVPLGVISKKAFPPAAVGCKSLPREGWRSLTTRRVLLTAAMGCRGTLPGH